MRSLELLAAGLWLVGLALAQDPTTTDTPDPPAPTFTGIDSFANVSVYQPDNAATEVVYARTENLPNNTVLVAWNDPSTTNTISLYQSTNAGFSWFTFGSATSDTTGRQLLQPHILYINGTYNGDTGTVLLAVNAVDKTSTNIEVYASYDSGQSFALVSSVVSGGAYNSSTAVSHPYLLYHGSSITIYYTTKKDTQHASKIVQQTTTEDYDSWGTAIDVVASSFKTDEPGMVSVTTLPNNKYVFAFQYGLFNNSTQSYSYPIYYKVASSPENAGTAPTLELRTTSGTVPAGGPSITWTSLGGANGTLVLSDSYSNSIFVNQAGGQGTWKEVKSTAGRAWAREVKVPYNDPNKVRFAGGAEQGQTSPSQILVTVLDLQKALASSK